MRETRIIFQNLPSVQICQAVLESREVLIHPTTDTWIEQYMCITIATLTHHVPWVLLVLVVQSYQQPPYFPDRGREGGKGEEREKTEGGERARSSLHI